MMSYRLAGHAATLAVQFASRLPGIPSAADFKRWVRATLSSPAEITLRIVNGAEGRNLNSAFRGKDYPTNVLTFVYHDVGGNKLQGDIVLCAPIVAREAREQKKILSHHYAHLTVHGLLHLAGFHHEDEVDAQKMEAREIAILGKLMIPDPYLSAHRGCDST